MAIDKILMDGVPTQTSEEQLECEQACRQCFLSNRLKDQVCPFQQVTLTALERAFAGSWPDSAGQPGRPHGLGCNMQVLLMRNKHVEYVQKGLMQLNKYFVSLDARFVIVNGD